jgi:hypothetical protein
MYWNPVLNIRIYNLHIYRSFATAITTEHFSFLRVASCCVYYYNQLRQYFSNVLSTWRWLIGGETCSGYVIVIKNIWKILFGWRCPQKDCNWTLVLPIRSDKIYTVKIKSYIITTYNDQSFLGVPSIATVLFLAFMIFIFEGCILLCLLLHCQLQQ